jgi:hypothetical protein
MITQVPQISVSYRFLMVFQIMIETFITSQFQIESQIMQMAIKRAQSLSLEWNTQQILNYFNQRNICIIIGRLHQKVPK